MLTYGGGEQKAEEGGGGEGGVGLILASQAAERVDAVLYRSTLASCYINSSQQVVL